MGGQPSALGAQLFQLLQIRPNLLFCNSFGGTPTVTGNGAGVAAVPATQLQGF